MSEDYKVAVNPVVTQAQKIVEKNLDEDSRLRILLIGYISTQQEGEIDSDEFLQMLAQLMYVNPDKHNTKHIKLFKEMSQAFQLPSRSLGYLKEIGFYSAKPVMDDKQSSAAGLEKASNTTIFKILQQSCKSDSFDQQKVVQDVSASQQLPESLPSKKSVYEKDLELAAIFQILHEAKIFAGCDKQNTINLILAIADVFSARLVNMGNADREKYIQDYLAVVKTLKEYQIHTPNLILAIADVFSARLVNMGNADREKYIQDYLAVVKTLKEYQLHTPDNILGYLSSPEKVSQFLRQQEAENAAHSSSNKKILTTLGFGKKEKEDKKVSLAVVLPLSGVQQLQVALKELDEAKSELALYTFQEDAPDINDVVLKEIQAKLTAQVERIKRVVTFIGDKSAYKQERKKMLECFEGLLEAASKRANHEIEFLRSKESAANKDLLEKAKEFIKEGELIARAAWLDNFITDINRVCESLTASAGSSKRWPSISGYNTQSQALQQMPSRYKKQPTNKTSQSVSSSNVSSQNASPPPKVRAASTPNIGENTSRLAFGQSPRNNRDTPSVDLFSPLPPPAEGTKPFARRGSTGS